MKILAGIAALAAAISGGSALAQSVSGHRAHHPQTAQVQPATPSPPAPEAQPGSQGSGTTSQGMMGQGGMMPGMGQGMMNCPMMQGGMMGQGMMGQGMMGGGMMGRGGMGPWPGMQAGASRGDESAGSLALGAINRRMHREMMMAYTGDVDTDFVRSMIPHHQGAIDMAKIVVTFGKDPKVRELAQNIIKAQEEEIKQMKAWLPAAAKP